MSQKKDKETFRDFNWVKIFSSSNVLPVSESLN